MKRTISATLVAGMLTMPLAASADRTDQYVNESRAAVKSLFKTLKGNLVGAMKAGGPIKAIEACNLSAQPLTVAEAGRLGYDIGRTSLRLRNPVNEADAWEIKVLQQFEARKSAGEDLKKMDYYEVVDSGGGKTFRYMKAIPAGKPCMVCHGDMVAPKVLEKIRSHYPLDQATGFKPGDLRGAFTISRKM
ncbi:MAG: DUF3365 domain-containing protein [Gammaproteobacteria bacterium]|uniref:DUF3365 domain-containing protein n=1 Tax=Candidatus Thiopontia autotrophica TaxID=2841688 RepID=A0A8J6NWR6_9GAMM|nr:DUF3365 domain-containing protein [Candidatus Thiopontia autotrophica]MBL6968926.1 DUF3365 domain-containing protein [Gammaproteobacteria bacterium]